MSDRESVLSRLLQRDKDKARPVFCRCDSCGLLLPNNGPALIRVGDGFFCADCSSDARRRLAMAEEGTDDEDIK